MDLNGPHHQATINGDRVKWPAQSPITVGTLGDQRALTFVSKYQSSDQATIRVK